MQKASFLSTLDFCDDDDLATGSQRKRRRSSTPAETWLEGPCVTETLISSLYGQFLEHMREALPEKSDSDILDETPPTQNRLPGSESTGKSSTIETLTKVPIFPVSLGRCTRCPIRVNLVPSLEEKDVVISFGGETFTVTPDNVQQTISNIFEDISEGTVKPTTTTTTAGSATPSVLGISPADGYTTQEITVTLEGPSYVKMSFVDLPGMVSYPPELHLFTKTLTQSYIQDSNTFILCVV